MSQSARVSSIDTLKDFRVALVKFCEVARQSLIALEMDSRRVIDWLQYDQLSRWSREVRHRHEKVLQVKTELNRIKLARATGQKVDLTEQKELLRAAQERLVAAEEKVETIRLWVRTVDRAIDEFKGQSEQLSALVEGDPPHSVVLMERMIESLDAYLQIAAPVSVAAPPARSDATPSA